MCKAGQLREDPRSKITNGEDWSVNISYKVATTIVAEDNREHWTWVPMTMT